MTLTNFINYSLNSSWIPFRLLSSQVIVMLCVVMLTFFVCWTPLYVIHTWYLFAPEFVYAAVGRTGISLIQLLAYWSSCCNPIIYCYMNRNFRQAVKSVSYECWRQDIFFTSVMVEFMKKLDKTFLLHIPFILFSFILARIADAATKLYPVLVA